MLTKLVRYGREFAIEIPAEIITSLGIRPESTLELTLQDGRIVLTPRPEIDEERFQKAVDFLLKNYGNAMKRLAES